MDSFSTFYAIGYYRIRSYTRKGLAIARTKCLCVVADLANAALTGFFDVSFFVTRRE